MNKRRFVIMITIVIIAIVIGIIIYGFLKNEEDKYVKCANEGDVTRYEWMRMLCEQEGLIEFNCETPYFSDVDRESIYFPYLQSAVEWEIVEIISKFEGEKYASGRFIALTAIKTIGEKKLQIYLDTEKAITDDAYLALAIEHGLVREEQLTRGLSKKECEQILDRLKVLYFGEFWRDDYLNVKYQDDVVELSAENVLQSNEDGTEIVVADNMDDFIEIGTILVFEQKKTKLKIARKVTGIGSDGTIILSYVELDQVFENFTMSDITELTFEDIVNYYGLREENNSVNNMKYQQEDESVINTAIFPFEENIDGFKLSVFTEESDEKRYIAVKIMRKNSGVSYTLPIRSEIEWDSDYSAEIDIDTIYVGGQVDYSFWNNDLKYADIAVDTQVNVQSSVKASEDKKILLCETLVPLGESLVSVEIQIYLVLSVEGGISFKAEIPVETSMHYEKDKGIRYTKHDIQVENPTIEVNCDTSVMLRLEPTMSILGYLNILNAEADIGVVANAKTVTRPNSQVCADISVCFPVMTLSVSEDDEVDTLIGFMGWSAKWEIISSDNAPIQKGLHYEILPDKIVQFVEKCTYVEKKEGEEKTENKESIDSSNLNNTYYTRYGKINQIGCPEFCFDYSDNWTVVREEVNDVEEEATYMNYYGEIIELINDRGVCITYTQYEMNPSKVGNGSAFQYIVEYDVTKVKDSKLRPLCLSTTKDSENFMVAKICEREDSVVPHIK